MYIADETIPEKWQKAYDAYRERLDSIFAFYFAILMLGTVVAYQFSHMLWDIPSPRLHWLTFLSTIPIYASCAVSLLAHYTGKPAWRPKSLLRLMALSLMLMVFGLILGYARFWPEGLYQAGERLMLSVFGVTLLATRGIRDWLVLFFAPLLLFALAAAWLRVPLISLTPFLFGPSIMLIVALVISEVIRRLSKYQFLREQEMTELATKDQLTGLLNRHAFLPLIKHAIARARREKHERFCLIMGDLDHFKFINDTYGHDFGDLVLRETAVRLGSCLREQDTICRWGGEEFLILLPVTDVHGAMEVARKILAAMADTEVRCKDPDRCRDISVQQTISLGMACFAEEDSAESLIARADRGLYEAKAEGRNRVTPIPAKMASEAESNLS